MRPPRANVCIRLEVIRAVGKQHAKMSKSQRAKQFAPFSALSGLSKALEERERFRNSERKDELSRISEGLDDVEFANFSVEDTEFADEYFYEPEEK